MDCHARNGRKGYNFYYGYAIMNANDKHCGECRITADFPHEGSVVLRGIESDTTGNKRDWAGPCRWETS